MPVSRIVTLEDLGQDVQEIVEALNIMLEDIETLKRKCQGLSERPKVEHCGQCGARRAGPNPKCHVCQAPLERS